MPTLAQALLAWFAREQRDLPWRRTRDPYAIWVSEIMLQQTRVDTVIPYYQRFLVRFPDVAALAVAPIEEVLTAWSGLGYYRRARSLCMGAREVVAGYGGRLPSDPRELVKLSGIGRYTAGAIASIAFGVRTPLVDGNVARVLARIALIEAPIEAPATVRELYALADTLVPSDNPGDFNQALMELGATLCTPLAPRCEQCPVQRECKAFSAGRQLELPVTAKKKVSPRVLLTALLVEEAGAVLLGVRPPEGLFGGMFEPPLVEGRGKALRDKLARAGLALHARKPPLGIRRHVLSHRVLEVTVVGARRIAEVSALEPYTELRFVPREQLAAAPLSSLAQHVLRLLPAEAGEAPAAAERSSSRPRRGRGKKAVR